MIKPDSIKFKVTPTIVKANEESTITIKSLDGNFKFFDETEYKVQFFPMEESDIPIDEKMSLLGYDENRKQFVVRPENGEIKVKYKFIGEQEWVIHIWCEDYSKHQNPLYKHYSENWGALIRMPQCGIRLPIYSLLPDLYGRTPLKGDLHIHTNASDGKESPELVAAAYRKAGYDFIAVTDHNMYDTAHQATKKLAFVKKFEIMKAEEIHNGYLGNFHMVNIGSDYSINDIYLNDAARIEKEVLDLKESCYIPQGINPREYLHRVWLYREIKKSGGYAIYPHPFWRVDQRYHIETKMSRAILENGLCDAFEVLGGCSPEENNMQVALYNDIRAMGKRLPIVASSDSHSVLEPLNSTHFKRATTVVFANERGILSAISDYFSTAVESVEGENVRVYGEFRLMKYTHFLLKNFFPLHDELCFVSGDLLVDYVCGKEELKEFIEMAEERVTDFGKEFFGW